MKICIYELSKDECAQLNQLIKEYDLDVISTEEPLSIKNVDLSKGCQAVTFLGLSKVDKDVIDQLHTNGVKYLSTRTIGINHIDIAYAKAVGLRLCNSSYGPEGVADFTIMLILLCLRNYKQALWRQQVNDFSLGGLIGTSIKELTIGVIGTGKIGSTVIKDLSGFGCKILAFDNYQDNEVKKYACYTSIEEIYQQCDLITLHIPLNEETRYMIDEQVINSMKDGVIIINAARGGLIDNQALIKGIESQKIGALGLDTIEEEDDIFHKNRMRDIISNRDMAYLKQFPNVVMTQHMAFYTTSSVNDMITKGIEGLLKMANGQECPSEL